MSNVASEQAGLARINLLFLDGEDLRAKTLEDRREALGGIISASGAILVSEEFAGEQLRRVRAVAPWETKPMARSKYGYLSIAVGAVAFALSAKRSLKPARWARSPLGPIGAAGSPARQVGRDAASPVDLSAQGWWQIAKRTAKKFSDNELMSEAASVTFFALLSLFPAITAIVSIYSLFADPSTIGQHLDAAAGFIPSGGMEIVREQLKRLTTSPTSGLSVGAIFGVLTALWSANQGSKAMFSALNDVYGEREERGFLRKTATSLAFTIGGVACLLIAVGAIVVMPIVFKQIGFESAFDLFANIARWPILLVGIVAALALLYRYGPSRHVAKWRWVSGGSAIAAMLWIGLSVGFSWYVEHFGSYNKTYGSLGAIIGFMTWIWLSSTVLLLGAQINAEMETQTGRDTTRGAEKPRGGRGGAAADTLA